MQLPTPLSTLQKLLERLQMDLRPGYVREFHEEVKAALRDGKLTEEELGQLELKREELGLSREVFDVIRQDLYMAAFQAVKESQEVTEEEWDELQHIQDFLELKDAEVAKTKKELYRMRILSEIKRGNMPIMEEEPIVLKPDEVVHWTEEAALMKNRKLPAKSGPILTLNPLEMMQNIGSKMLQRETSEEGWIVRDRGLLIITNKRLVYKGKKDASSIRYASVIDVECFVNGLRIFHEKHAPIFFRYVKQGNHNVVGSVLLHAIAYDQR